MAGGEIMSEPIPKTAPPSREARTRLIGELAAAAKATRFAPLRGRFQEIPVIEAPDAMLLYRVENGRLIAELEEYAGQHGVDLTDLRARQETVEVQRLLHRLLADKAASPAGPILQELAEVGVQTEPLLITGDGVLINGNRRLAAMRELLRRDPQRYAGFAVASAAVMPADVTTAEMETTEAALQMAPETKLAYGWINRRLKLRRQREDLGLSDETIARAYRLPDPKRIDAELGELALAESYLEHFVRAPGHYSDIADAELLFAGLYAQLQSLSPRLAEPWRQAGLAMIHGRSAVEGPMDRHFPFADPAPGQMPTLALRQFAEERRLVSGGEDSPLDADALQALARMFADPEASGALAPELYGLMERIRAEFQNLSSPTRAIQLLEKLRDTLFRLDPDKLTPAQRRQIKSEVAAIQAQTAVLLDENGAPTAIPKPPGSFARLFRGEGR